MSEKDNAFIAMHNRIRELEYTLLYVLQAIDWKEEFKDVYTTANIVFMKELRLEQSND